MPELTITNASITLGGLVAAGGCLYLLYRLLFAASRGVGMARRALAMRAQNRRAENAPGVVQPQPVLNVLWDAPLAVGTAMPINSSPHRSETPGQPSGETNRGATSPVPRGPQTLTRGMKWALAFVAIIAAGLILYGFTGSYSTLFHLATLHGVPLPLLNPIGVDAGLVGVVLLDIVLTWIGYPIAWLRQIARGLAIATVALNASAGWPDATAVTLHVFAPVLIIVIIEAARVTLLRRARIADNTYRDPIPIMRWILDPFHTPGFYRRMVLWGQTSYPAAIDLEIQRRQAIMALRAVYGGGRTWRKRAPADLVWMITSGVRIGDVLTRVRDIVAAESDARKDMQAPLTGPEGPDMVAAGSDVTTGHGHPDAGPDMRRGLRGVRDRASDRAVSNESDDTRDVSPETGRDPDTDTDTEAAALAILAEEPDISGAELGRRLNKTERHGSRLKRALSDSIRTEATRE